MFKPEPENSIEVLQEGPAELDGEAAEEEQKTVRPEDESRLEQLLTAVDALQEQFQEKIAVDAHKNALFDEMHRELIRYRNGALDKLVETMALDIIQLADSAKRSLCAYEEKEASEDNYRQLLGVVQGIIEDLDDVLYRQSIEPYQVAGDAVDVRRQKIIQTVETAEEARNHLVAARVAVGYEKDGKVIRPERIRIYKYSPQKAEEA